MEMQFPITVKEMQYNGIFEVANHSTVEQQLSNFLTMNFHFNLLNNWGGVCGF